MRTLKLIFALIVITSLLFCQSLKKEVESLYAGKTVKWEKDFSRLNYISAAKESECFVIGEVFEDHTGKISYYNSEGDLLWSVDNSIQNVIKKVSAIGTKISDYGGVVIATWGYDESGCYQIYNKSGELLYTERRQGGPPFNKVIMSPDGYYNNLKHPLCNKYGEKIDLHLPFSVSRSSTYGVSGFLSNKYILCGVDEYTPEFNKPFKYTKENEKLRGKSFWFIYDLDNQSVVKIGEPKDLSLGDYYTVAVFDHYFLLGDPSNNTSYLYNEKGEEVFSKKGGLVFENRFQIRQDDFHFCKEKMELYIYKKNTLYGYSMHDGSKLWKNTIENQDNIYLFNEASIYIKSNKLFLTQFKRNVIKDKAEKFVTKIWELNGENRNSVLCKDMIHIIPGKVLKMNNKMKYYSD